MELKNFKEALIAHLNGEKVEVYSVFRAFDLAGAQEAKWRDFGDFYETIELGDVEYHDKNTGYQFRIKPKTMLCNGVEVFPVEKPLACGTPYYVPSLTCPDSPQEHTWTASYMDHTYLMAKIVHSNKEDAIARAKAMLILKEGE